MHQVVVSYRNAGRAGTKAQKSRSDMSATKKFKKQKGGGAVTIYAPIFVGGGVVRRTPARFAQKVNRKMYRGAFASILSETESSGSSAPVVESFGIDQPKTKALVGKRRTRGVGSHRAGGRERPEALYLRAQRP